MKKKLKKLLLTILFPSVLFATLSINLSASFDYGTTYRDLYTNYRVKDLAYTSYEKINTFIEHPLIEDRLIFGKIEKYGESLETVSMLTSESGPWGKNKVYGELSRYAYTYTYLTNIEYPYQVIYESDMRAGDRIEKTFEKVNSISLSASIQAGVKAEYSSKINVAKKGIAAEVDKKVSTEIKTTIETNYMTSERESLTRIFTVPKDGFYRLERRLQVKVYALSMYEILYDPLVVDNSKWYTKNIEYKYDEGTKLYKYLGTEYVYEQVKNVEKLTLYSFDTTNHEYKYDDIKESCVIYF